jgi:hypothetical protein
VVLLGRIVDVRVEAWQAMPEGAKAQVRQALWQAFLEEPDTEMVRKLSHAIAKASQGWPKLVEALVSFLNTTPDHSRQVGVFYLFEQMSEYSDELQGNPTQLLAIFRTALATDSAVPLPVRTAALKALLSLLTNLETKANIERHVTHEPLTKGGKGGPAEGLLPLGEAALGSLVNVLEGYGQGQMPAEELQAVLELVADAVEYGMLQGAGDDAAYSVFEPVGVVPHYPPPAATTPFHSGCGDRPTETTAQRSRERV